MASSPTDKPSPPPTQKAVFSYFSPQPCHAIEKAYEILSDAFLDALSRPCSNLSFEERIVEIEDVRGREGEFELNVQGFRFLRHESRVLDFKNRGEVEGVYFREVEELIRRELGESVKRVYVFGWKMRSSAPSENVMDGDGGSKVSLPTRHPHVDQSTTGALRRLHYHLPDEAEELLKGHFRIINVWRPLNTVTAYPLALCDARTVKPEELVPKDQIGKEFTGESFLVRWSEVHKWRFLGEMCRREVVLIKVFDSEKGNGEEVNCCVHSSFELEGKNWEGLRESIEARVMVFDFPPGEKDG